MAINLTSTSNPYSKAPTAGGVAKKPVAGPMGGLVGASPASGYGTPPPYPTTPTYGTAPQYPGGPTVPTPVQGPKPTGVAGSFQQESDYQYNQAAEVAKAARDKEVAAQAAANQLALLKAQQTGGTAAQTQAEQAALTQLKAQAGYGLQQQQAGIAGQQGLQTSAQGASAQQQQLALQQEQARQAEAEKAAAGLQQAGFAGQAADLTQRDQLNQANESRNFDRFQTVTNQSPTSQGMDPNEEAARAAAFARAKDQTGEITRGALTGLQDSLAGADMLGGGAEAAGTASVINGGAGRLADTSREQLIQDLTRGQQVSDRNVAAGLTTRAQNMQALQALFGQGGRLY